MSRALLTFVIQPGEPGLLTQTVKSIELFEYQTKIILALVWPENTKEATEQVVSKGEAIGGFAESRTEAGVPYSAIAISKEFGQGRTLNAALETAVGHTDIFVFLRAGDIVEPSLPNLITSLFEEELGQVGMVWWDSFGDERRLFVEPFGRTRILQWPSPAPSRFAVSRIALDMVGMFDPEAGSATHFEFAMRISERFIILHVPEPLHRGDVESPVEPADWIRVINLTNQRAG